MPKVRQATLDILGKAEKALKEKGAAASDFPGAADAPEGAAATLPAFEGMFSAQVTRRLDVVVGEHFQRILNAAKAGKGQGKALTGVIGELASFLEGVPAKKINYGGQLGRLRKALVMAVRTGATAEEVGLLASGGLLESGAVKSQAGREKVRSIVQSFEARTGKGVGLERVREAAGSMKAGKAGRFFGHRAVKGLAPYAGLMALDFVMEGRRAKQKNREEIQRILEKASGGGQSPFGPLQTVEFVEAMGPEFIESMMQDPSLVIALHDRLQSVATGNLPRGTAVLRTAAGQAGAGLDPEILLRQLGGE